MRPGAATSKIVQDFLNVTGIVGFALMDGPHLDYFYHLNGRLQAQEQVLFAQNVAEVCATIPPEFWELDFQLQTHWTHLYRLDRVKVFVVWVGNAADRQQYRTVLPPLLQILRDAPGPALDQLHILTHGMDAETGMPISQGALAVAEELPSLSAMLGAINHVIQSGVEFLGKRILANQVLMARPQDAWLVQLSLNSDSQLVAPPSLLVSAEPLTADQYASLKRWADEIILAVRRVIRDFREILEREMNPLDFALLFEPAGRPAMG
jgi:hypothetical protein